MSALALPTIHIPTISAMVDKIVYDFPDSQVTKPPALAGWQRWSILGSIILVVLLAGAIVIILLKHSVTTPTNTAGTANANTTTNTAAPVVNTAPATTKSYTPTVLPGKLITPPTSPSSADLQNQLPTAIQQLNQNK